MILRELYYFDKETMEPVEDERYDAHNDQSIIQPDDTRKTRLTLRDINRARRADDMHQREYKKDLIYIRKMYSSASQEPNVGGVPVI